MEEYLVAVREKVITQDIYYKNHLILHYTIKYPKFVSGRFHTMADKLNLLYRTKALMYEKYKVMKLYQMAMAEYENSVVHGFPIHQYEAYVDYIVSYNQDCALSLYFDQYEYTGGAHGNTLRYSDTWDMQRSRRISLSDLFRETSDYKEYIIQNINSQIENEIMSGSAAYFDHYDVLVRNNFKDNNFYLTPEGVEIYYQQYDIAPYSSGIPTFLIPYSLKGPLQPKCT